MGIILGFKIFSAFLSIFLVLIIQKPKLLYVIPVQLKLSQFTLRYQIITILLHTTQAVYTNSSFVKP